MTGEVEGTDLERMAHVDPGTLQNYHQDSLGGNAGESRTGLLEMGQGGKERWRELGYLTVRTAEPDGLKITTGGFQTEKGKSLCLGMLKIHEVVQKGAVAKT